MSEHGFGEEQYDGADDGGIVSEAVVGEGVAPNHSAARWRADQQSRSGRGATISDAPDAVDWEFAATTAGRLVPPGPRATYKEAGDLVVGLRQAALDAVEPILETTQMSPAIPQDADADTAFGDVFVVDRPRWAEANAQMMRVMAEPMTRAINATGKNTQATRTASAAEVGTVLALLSTRVLGQFDPYSVIEVRGVQAAPRGRLLLSAPNILAAQRQMKVVPKDFWLWVALHEQTHGLQFAAAPWLTEYLRGQIDELLTEITGRTIGAPDATPNERLQTMLATIKDLVTGTAAGQAPMERLLSESALAKLHQITAVMSLLEGHADVMMDAVGPSVVPTVSHIRSQFEKRRDGVGAGFGDVLLRRLMGMDAKLAQYRDGAQFVRGVEDKVGREGLNAVWLEADNLPTIDELADPSAWVSRVYG